MPLELNLKFLEGAETELTEVRFFHPLVGKLHCVRGRTQGLYAQHVGTFQWSGAVKALCILFLDALSRNDSQRARLSGEAGSFASSLDYALGKPPCWLQDMFGLTSSGEALAKRLFLRDNPERKRPGPVAVCLNPQYFREAKITASVNGSPISSDQAGRIVSELSDRVSHNILAQSEFHPLDLTELKKEFIKEAINGLFKTDCFSSHGRNSVKSRVEQDLFTIKGPPFKFLNDALFSTTLTSSESLGFLHQETLALEALRLKGPIRVAIPQSAICALVIFEYMKSTYNLPFEIEYEFLHAIEIKQKIEQGHFFISPDLIVLGIAPAATFLPSCQKYNYQLSSIMPAISHRLLAASIDRKQDCRSAALYLLNCEPSTSLIYFKELVLEKRLLSQKTSLVSAEPHEIPAILQNPERDAFIISYFPYWYINHRHFKSPLVDNPCKAPRLKECVLYIHKRLGIEPAINRTLQILIRRSWLDLRIKPEVVGLIIESLFKNERFICFLKRSSGSIE